MMSSEFCLLNFVLTSVCCPAADMYSWNQQAWWVFVDLANHRLEIYFLFWLLLKDLKWLQARIGKTGLGC